MKLMFSDTGKRQRLLRSFFIWIFKSVAFFISVFQRKEELTNVVLVMTIVEHLRRELIAQVVIVCLKDTNLNIRKDVPAKTQLGQLDLLEHYFTSSRRGDDVKTMDSCILGGT